MARWHEFCGGKTVTCREAPQRGNVRPRFERVVYFVDIQVAAPKAHRS